MALGQKATYAPLDESQISAIAAVSSMSALGQAQTCAVHQLMSALGQKWTSDGPNLRNVFFTQLTRLRARSGHLGPVAFKAYLFQKPFVDEFNFFDLPCNGIPAHR
jgi:hypothetical protein